MGNAKRQPRPKTISGGPKPLRTPCSPPHWTRLPFCPRFSFGPNVPRNAGQNNNAKADQPTFEEALKKLETIVEAMESEELAIETLLAKYEEGTQLAKICQDKLAEAELKIQQLEKNAAGEITLKRMQSSEV